MQSTANSLQPDLCCMLETTESLLRPVDSAESVQEDALTRVNLPVPTDCVCSDQETVLNVLLLSAWAWCVFVRAYGATPPRSERR